MPATSRLQTPEPPTWQLDWGDIEANFPWIQAMSGCPQSPTYHREGDVLTHTRLVAEAMVALEKWRALPSAERTTLFWAALLHDVAKPACTRPDPVKGYVAPGHAPRGALMAREILWKLGMAPAQRERVVALIRHHLKPFNLFDRERPAREAHRISQTARCCHLSVLAEADARGRICDDQQALIDNVALFGELCREERCWEQPRQFASDHSRLLYFRKPERDPDYRAHDDSRCEVVLLSGLPGAGKDSYRAEHLTDRPVISLDRLRRTLGVGPTGRQRRVVARATEIAREHLRASEGFVWNATNLSRRIREPLVSLFLDYRARVRIVYLEASYEELRRRNRERAETVPEAIVERLLRRWEVPDRTEAHQVDYVWG